jgi:hypothetical protein
MSQIKAAPRSGTAARLSGIVPTWAQRLKRVFRIDIKICERCGGGGLKPYPPPGIRARRGCLPLLPRAVRESSSNVAISGSATAHQFSWPPPSPRATWALNVLF